MVSAFGLHKITLDRASKALAWNPINSRAMADKFGIISGVGQSYTIDRYDSDMYFRF